VGDCIDKAGFSGFPEEGDGGCGAKSGGGGDVSQVNLNVVALDGDDAWARQGFYFGEIFAGHTVS